MSELKALSSRKPGRLSDLVDLVRDKCAPTSSELDVPCINLEDIPEGVGRAVSWSKASENLSIKTKFRAGDILFGKLRPYLRKYAQPAFDGVCTSELLAFRAKPGVDPRYAYQVVASQEFIDHCVAASFGTKMPRTDWRTASSFPTQIPGEAEQRRIADLLSAVDEQIELLEDAARKKNALLLGLIDSLLLNGPRLKTLVDFCEVGPKTSALNAPFSVPFVSMDSVSEVGTLIRREPRPWLSVSKGFTRFTGGDVLVAKITPCFENGKGFHAPEDEKLWAGSTEFHVLRAREGVSPRWVFWHTRSREFLTKGSMQMTGSAGQQRVPRRFIEEFPVLDDELALQVKKAALLDAVSAELRMVEAQIEKLKKQKHGLLSDLFRPSDKTRGGH